MLARRSLSLAPERSVPTSAQRADCRERAALVPIVHAVVPGKADPLRATTCRGEAKPPSTARTVEQPRPEVQTAKLPPERTPLDGRHVRAEAPVARLVCPPDRLGGQQTVLECERDALAHERVDARRVAHEERVRRRETRATRVRMNREGLPRRGRGAHALEHPGELGAETRSIRRRQRVDTHVGMCRPVDDARERPPVTAQAGRAWGEIEVVAPPRMTRPRRAGDRYIAHDRSRRDAARPDQRAPDDTAAAVGTDDDRRPVRPSRGVDAYPVAVPRDVGHVLLLAELDAPV